MEDLFSPETNSIFRGQKSMCNTYCNGRAIQLYKRLDPNDKEKLIDFIRIHISDIGGITPTRKIAAMGELMGVKTAWHGPGDTSPVGHTANMMLNLNCQDFGIQEAHIFGEKAREVFLVVQN